MSSQTSNNNIKKISICLLTLAVIAVSILSLTNLVFPQKTKLADASGSTTSNLIIGTTDTGNAIELSVCVQATPGPIHLTNVSTWFQFNTSSLTTTANTFIQKGQYGNSNNGYGALKWQEVAGTQNGTSDTYTMSLIYSGDGVTPGLAGLPMATTPELFGRVNFIKVSGSTDSTALNLVKNLFYSTENPTTAINQTVSYVNGDCVTSNNVIIKSSISSIPANTVSSSPIVAALSSSLIPPSSRMTSSSVSVIIPPINIIITPNTQVPNIPVPMEFTIPGGLSNNISATFKFPGSNTPILGMISNNVFVPNVGQTVPNDVLTFYSANSFGNGVLTVGSQTYNIPTNVVNNTYIPSNRGGSITISLDNKSTLSSQTSKSSVSNNVPIATEAQTNIESKNNGVFKSKLKITDPYVCGVGSYGNVPNAKDFGVEYVYYELYKKDSTTASYNYKLKLNNNGDFFLPLSSSNNIVAQGDYRFVFYAIDKEGGKAQGEFTDFVTDNCNPTSIKSNVNSVRTGGSDYILTTSILLTLILTLICMVRINNKFYYNSSIFGKK